MKKTILILLAVLCAPLFGEVYELRTYYANEGKMEGLLARFRNHTTKIFESHGMKNIGYWLTDEEDPKLVYVISHKDRETAKSNWKAFGSDPAWKKAKADSVVDGALVKKVVSQFLNPTDFSKLK
jgi:heme-degrading monooxygenase HmoA